MSRTYGRKRGANPHFSAERVVESTTPLPRSYSYDMPYDPAVFDQAAYPDCVSNAVCGNEEEYHAKRGFGVISMSRSAHYAMTKHAYESDDIALDGLVIQDGLMTPMHIGYVLEADWSYPTDPSGQNPGNMLTQPPASIIKTDFNERGYIVVDPLDNEQALRLFVDHGPQIVGSDFPLEWENIGEDGVVDPKAAKTDAGGHCYRRIAYDLDYLGGAWFCRNSWGRNYGHFGNFWVPFTAQSICPQFWPDEAYATRWIQHPSK